MFDIEQIRKNVILARGEEWSIFADAVGDEEFYNILPTSEQQILDHFRNNTNTGSFHSFQEQSSNILFKYISWFSYKNSNLKSIKKRIDSLSKEISENGSNLNTITETAQYITGATALVSYANVFSDRATIHEENASTQHKYYLISLLGLAAIISVTFFVSVTEFSVLENMIAEDVKFLPLNVGIFAFKMLVLIFTYQITQFFKRNYNAEKHLQEVYQHRSDVLQSLHAVYEALKENPEESQKILSAGAVFAYERGETGYITTKEGAGSAGDGLIENVLVSIIKK